MTTNAGSENSNSISGFAEHREMREKEKVEKALSQFLRPEFINRIDEIIAFRHLDKSDFARIADIMLGKLKNHLAERGIKLVYTPECLDYIAEESYSEKYGARNMRRYIERNIEDRIASLMIDSYDKPISGISLVIKNNAIAIDSI